MNRENLKFTAPHGLFYIFSNPFSIIYKLFHKFGFPLEFQVLCRLGCECAELPPYRQKIPSVERDSFAWRLNNVSTKSGISAERYSMYSSNSEEPKKSIHIKNSIFSLDRKNEMPHNTKTPSVGTRVHSLVLKIMKNEKTSTHQHC